MSVLEGLKEKERRTKIRELTVDQAQQELAELRRHLFDLRLGMMRGEQRDVREFARTRKNIARLLYKLRMIQLLGGEEDLIHAPEAGEEPEEEAERVVVRKAKPAAVAVEKPVVEDEAATDDADEAEDNEVADESDEDEHDESDDADEAEESDGAENASKADAGDGDAKEEPKA